jgi:HAD superfamily hydrolase (TIGR01509 family)
MKAVIFDLGRVLVYYDHTITLAGINRITNATPAELRDISLMVLQTMGTGKMDGPEFFDFLCQKTEVYVTYDEFESIFCRSQARNDAALAYAMALHKRPQVKVGVISNTNAIHAGWLRGNLPELAIFDSVILSNEVGLLKPDPGIYKLSLQQLKTAPQNALFIDDVAQNVAGAESIGIKGLLHENWSKTRTIIETWLNQ